MRVPLDDLRSEPPVTPSRHARRSSLTIEGDTYQLHTMIPRPKSDLLLRDARQNVGTEPLTISSRSRRWCRPTGILTP